MHFHILKKGTMVAAAGAIAVLASIAGPALAQPANDATTNSADAQFVKQAVASGNKEIAQARAELRSSDASVRLYAQTIIRDHTNANTQIIALAKTEGLSYPEASGSAPAMLPPKTYMQDEVRDHQQAIALFKGEAANGSRQFKTIAASTVPILENHLAMAQQYLHSGTVSPEATPSP